MQISNGSPSACWERATCVGSRKPRARYFTGISPGHGAGQSRHVQGSHRGAHRARPAQRPHGRAAQARVRRKRCFRVRGVGGATAASTIRHLRGRGRKRLSLLECSDGCFGAGDLVVTRSVGRPACRDALPRLADGSTASEKSQGNVGLRTDLCRFVVLFCDCDGNGGEMPS